MANRLLHVSPNCFPPVHEDHHTKRIWQELAKGFDEYHILARSKDNRYRYSREDNIHLHLLPKVMERSRIFFFTSLWMLYLIRRHGITHILVQCPVLGGPIAAFASGLFKIPLMVEIHGEEYFKYIKGESFSNFILSKISRYSLSHATKIRALSPSMVKKLERCGIQDNVVIIPNRADLSIFNKLKSDYSIKGQVKLVSVGSFLPVKGYLDLIKFLHSSDIDFSLTLIGGGVMRGIYEEYINRNGLADRVTLVDQVSQKELADLVVNRDIYIQFSEREGVPRALIEAMAMRMPIISTDVGSINGILEDRKNAILLRDRNERTLVESVKELVNNEKLRQNIAAQSYEDVKEKYEWNKVFNLYRDVLLGMK